MLKLLAVLALILREAQCDDLQYPVFGIWTSNYGCTKRPSCCISCTSSTFVGNFPSSPCTCPCGSVAMQIRAANDCEGPGTNGMSVTSFCIAPQQTAAFGGLYLLNDRTCFALNPYTKACSCPAGFEADSVYLQTHSEIEARLVVCRQPWFTVGDDYAGVYQLDDDNTCRVPNFATQACRCPVNSYPLAMRAIVGNTTTMMTSSIVFCSFKPNGCKPEPFYTACTKPCDGGTQTKYYLATAVPSCGGDCLIPASKTIDCNTHCCPVNCQSIAVPGPCSAPCGGGVQNITRVVTRPASCGGAQCPSWTLAPCNTAPCTTVSPTRQPSTLTPTTQQPTALPTALPTSVPTHTPSVSPTHWPTTVAPTHPPTQQPSTAAPSVSPSESPSQSPTTTAPTAQPSLRPTHSREPTVAPSRSPSPYPTERPTDEPTEDQQRETVFPTIGPSNKPTYVATRFTRSPGATAVPSLSWKPGMPSALASPVPSASPSLAPATEAIQAGSSHMPWWMLLAIVAGAVVCTLCCAYCFYKWRSRGYRVLWVKKREPLDWMKTTAGTGGTGASAGGDGIHCATHAPHPTHTGVSSVGMVGLSGEPSWPLSNMHHHHPHRQHSPPPLPQQHASLSSRVLTTPQGHPAMTAADVIPPPPRMPLHIRTSSRVEGEPITTAVSARARRKSTRVRSPSERKTGGRPHAHAHAHTAAPPPPRRLAIPTSVLGTTSSDTSSSSSGGSDSDSSPMAPPTF